MSPHNFEASAQAVLAAVLASCNIEKTPTGAYQYRSSIGLALQRITESMAAAGIKTPSLSKGSDAPSATPTTRIPFAALHRALAIVQCHPLSIVASLTRDIPFMTTAAARRQLEDAIALLSSLSEEDQWRIVEKSSFMLSILLSEASCALSDFSIMHTDANYPLH